VASRLWRANVALLLACSLAEASCVALPPLSQATNNLPFAVSIPIHDVVQRVKCGLADALYDRVYRSKDPVKFAWMRNWTAKADLTLEINDSGGITPSFTFTNPLQNAFITGLGPSSINTATGAVTNVVGATSQNFAFGASGTFSGNATRTETLSFNISMAELKDWQENRQHLIDSGQELTGIYSCDPAAPTDLQEDLDLRAWLEEALKPVELGDLQPGIHPTPSTGGGPTASAPVSTGAGGGIKALIAQEPSLPQPTIKYAREKAFFDVSLSTYLAELGVPYDLSDSAYYEPANQTEKNCTIQDNEPGKSVTFRPPPYPGSSTSNASNSQDQQSLVQQSLTNAQNAQASASEVWASQTLDTRIKSQAQLTALAARGQALRVQMASQYAAQHVLEVCEADTLYVKPDTCITPAPVAGGGGDPKVPKIDLGTSTKYPSVDSVVTLTAAVSISGSAGPPIGNVTFTDGTKTWTAPLQQGVATVDEKFDVAGIHSIRATYIAIPAVSVPRRNEKSNEASVDHHPGRDAAVERSDRHYFREKKR
jgi:hypothetical protein